jgi:diguanylate cyclase (GGDEF)-like protein/PAS domain S-box-containing protein
VLFLALVPLTVIVILISVHFAVIRIQDLDKALLDRGQAIARQLAPACEYGVVSGNRAILVNLAQAALRETDVVSISITEMQGGVLASAQRSPEGHPPERRLPDQTQEFRAPIYQSEVILEEHPGAAAPAATRSRPVEPARQAGWVAVELSRAPTKAKQNRVLAESLAIIFIGLGFTTFIALRMARGVTRPILALTEVVQKIKGGGLSHRVTIAPGGELGRLVDGINSMAAALAEAREREHKRTEDALFLEKVRAQVTLESIGDGVITTDAGGRIVYLNSVAEQFTEWSRDDARGLPLNRVFRIFDETANEVEEYPIHYCLEEGRTIRHDSHHLLMSKDGAKIEIQDSAAPIRDRDGSVLGAVVVFHDVTEIQGMARRMAFLASHDPLTGLLNRREFETRLQQVLESARSDGKEHALCYLDLDQFKIVNDTCGHTAGDELLKQLAHHLQKEIRTSDVLARLGGDEFGVILESCSIDKARQIADLLRQFIKDFRFVWHNRTFEVGVSIGLVPIGADAGSLTDVLSAADSACYVAKDHGRNRIHLYQPDDAALAQRHGEMQWVHRLRHGLENNSFDLYCQAIVPLREEAVRAGRFYEILVRIQDKDLVLPATFIPAAERYHLMPAIDRWVLESVFTMLKRYYSSLRQNGGGRGISRFAVNLSGQSLGDEKFVDFVVDRILHSGIKPDCLCFEITETAAIANLTRARDFIARLKKMGCQFALDDFGSGLSSFGYLKSLPVDYLKIAGDFIRDIGDDPVDHAMVDAINQIGHVMGLVTIAESVEGPAILEKLRESGVDYAQGVGIEPPRPLHEVLELPAKEWITARAAARVAI